VRVGVRLGEETAVSEVLLSNLHYFEQALTEGIPADVESFTRQFITSVGQLEVLLLLHRTAPQAWSGEAVARELRTSSASASAKLEDLKAAGLVGVADPALPTYRFHPRRADDARLVGDLARAYSTRSVTVVGLIFSRPSDSVRSFADAFKLRRKDEDG
jgi:hypothetical protein